MPDIRKSIEEDRGLLKKIQLHFPGFIGYRSKEDLRAADSFIRIQLANRLAEIKDGLEECRRVLVDEYKTNHLEELGTLLNKFQTLEGKVRHAEQGYSGISPAIRIEENELERLYEYDFGMITYVLDIEKGVVDLRKAVDAKAERGMKDEFHIIRTRLADFERTFKERIERVAGIFNF